jgi:hypothetical protein
MGSRVVITQPTVCPCFNATLDGSIDEVHRSSIVPILRTGDGWRNSENEGTKEQTVSHRCPISLCIKAAATTIALSLLTSCSDLTPPLDEVFGIADLLILLQQSNAPAPTAKTFWVANSRQTIVRINHPDNFNTLFLELEFPAQSITSLNGAPLSATDSLRITVDPRSAEYGFVLSPPGVVFTAGSTPAATFSFSVYGDAGASNNPATYESSAEYVAALRIWREVTVDEWQIALNSSITGVDEIGARLETSGRFVLAAPR